MNQKPPKPNIETVPDQQNGNPVDSDQNESFVLEGNPPNDSNISGEYEKNDLNKTGETPQPVNVKSLLSLILAITSIVLSIFAFYIGIPLAIIALVLGILGLREIKTTTEPGRKMAIAGIIISVISILAPIVLAVIAAIAFMTFTDIQ